MKFFTTNFVILLKHTSQLTALLCTWGSYWKKNHTRLHTKHLIKEKRVTLRFFAIVTKTRSDYSICALQFRSITSLLRGIIRARLFCALTQQYYAFSYRDFPWPLRLWLGQLNLMLLKLNARKTIKGLNPQGYVACWVKLRFYCIS